MNEYIYDKLKIIIEDTIPFNSVLGLQVTSLSPGKATLTIPFREELIGDRHRPAIHGGVISALIDTAGGAAMFTEIGPKDLVSTVDLRVDYLRPAGKASIAAEAEIVRLGNRVGMVRVKVMGNEPSELVAEGVAVYSVYRADV